LGVEAAVSPAALAERCRTVVTSLPHIEALSDAVNGLEMVSAGGLVIDTNTFAATDKEAASRRLADAGWRMIDCTISGNHDMVVTGDYAFFVSGAPADLSDCRPLLDLLSNRIIELGAFGDASKIKLILNHLVMIHTAAAAEAMALAAQAGLDLQTVYDLVTSSSASSEIFALRGKMMVDEDYRSSRGNYHVIMKDADIISALAQTVRFPIPLFSLATQLHMLGVAGGWAEQDTASLATVFRRNAAPLAEETGG